MGLYLLTGAGFTRNWGGWLANEAFEYLIGCSGMTPRITRLLWQAHKTGGGFEAVYQQLYDESRTAVIPPAQFATFHEMVAGMFHTMQIGFHSVEFLGMYVMILTRFDEIYTVNQDTFLELNYMNWNILEASQGRFFGVDCPGVGLVDTMAYERPGLFVENELGEFSVKTRHQPYYKLHGQLYT